MSPGFMALQYKSSLSLYSHCLKVNAQGQYTELTHASQLLLVLYNSSAETLRHCLLFLANFASLSDLLKKKKKAILNIVAADATGASQRTFVKITLWP